MKKILAVLAVAFMSIVGCSQINDALYPKPSPRQRLLKDWEISYALWLLANPILDTSVACTLPPSNNYDNPIYGQNDYYPMYVNQPDGFINIWIGDSTIDLSRKVSGWYDATKTLPVPTSGNRFCDMIRQWTAFVGRNNMGQTYMKQTHVQTVFIATAGGNDLLQGEDSNEIIKNGKILIDKTRSTWPNAKIVMVAIHPTQVASANAGKATTNTAIKNYLLSLSNTCWYDPGPDPNAFNVPEGSPANSSDMVDSIHYNSAMSLKIKTALQVNCGVTF